jgi:MFS family permease
MMAGRVPAVLREHPQFRLLFAGQALSGIGDRITFVALPFAVLETGAGAAQVGFVAAATTIPFFVFSLAAGVWADRLDRRTLMLASDIVRLLCQALAGSLLIAGAAEWQHLAAIALVYGTADAFFQPAVYGLLPEIVPPAQLQQANALRGLVDSSGLVIGPAVAGLLVLALGAGGALLLDSATFAFSIACLVRLRRDIVEKAVAAEPEQDFWRGLRDGWHEVRTRSWVLAMLGGLATYHLVVLPSVFALGPVLANDELGGAGAWAAITAGFGAGSLIGQLVLLRWRPRFAVRASAACLIVAACQAAIIGSGLPVVAIAGLEACAGVAVTCYFVLWETSIQEQIPPAAVSRVGSYDLFVATGFLPLGVAIAGPVSASIGLQETLVGMSAVGVVAALIVLSVPSVRTLPRPDAPL